MAISEDLFVLPAPALAPDATSTSPPHATPESRAHDKHLAPHGTRPLRVSRGYAAAIALVHLASLLVFVPWLFSWTGVALLVAGHYCFGLLGMTLGYHRLLAHRAFRCSKWFEHLLALLGVCCLQDAPARWVAVHRKHHLHSDDEPDPHSPLVTFFWGHMGWLLVENRDLNRVSFYDHYARDLLRDPFYMRLERNLLWLWLYVGHAALFFAVGFAVGWATTGQWLAGVQFGLSLVVWGVLLRTVLVWHVTWSVNSLTHWWGYRNYPTRDNSRNNWLVGILAHGEGWHNNHHAQQGSAAHGHRWWEVDLTYRTICLLEWVGLARDVIRPHTQYK